MKKYCQFLFLAAVCLHYGTSFELRIKEGRPSGNDSYLCSAMEMPTDHAIFLTSFKKAWNTTNAHHMIIMTCNFPGSDEPNWDCKPHSHHSQPVCMDQPNFVFSWAMEAPGFRLPTDSSFKVGKGSPNTQFLVLQVHYKNADKFDQDETLLDDSGFEITTQTTPTKNSVGIFLSETGGFIPAKSLVYLEAMCEVQPAVKIQPIAYRVHAHRLCDLISIFRIRDGKWSALGLQSPKKPQTFYSVIDPKLDIKSTDIIATRCVMNNTLRNEDVYIGDDAKDEMCNSYLMYSYPADVKLQMDSVCSSEGFPEFSWLNFFDEKEIPVEAMKNLETGELMLESYEDNSVDDEINFLGNGF